MKNTEGRGQAARVRRRRASSRRTAPRAPRRALKSPRPSRARRSRSRARRGARPCRLCPPTTGTRFAFRSILVTTVRFQVRFRRSRVQKTRAGHVALQNTLDRPKPDTVSTTLKHQRESQIAACRWTLRATAHVEHVRAPAARLHLRNGKQEILK